MNYSIDWDGPGEKDEPRDCHHCQGNGARFNHDEGRYYDCQYCYGTGQYNKYND